MKYSRKRVRKLIKNVDPDKVAKFKQWRESLSEEQKTKYLNYLRKRIVARKAQRST